MVSRLIQWQQMFHDAFGTSLHKIKVNYTNINHFMHILFHMLSYNSVTLLSSFVANLKANITAYKRWINIVWYGFASLPHFTVIFLQNTQPLWMPHSAFQCTIFYNEIWTSSYTIYGYIWYNIVSGMLHHDQTSLLVSHMYHFTCIL